jgi:hypothetical protein
VLSHALLRSRDRAKLPEQVLLTKNPKYLDACVLTSRILCGHFFNK